MWGTVTLSVPTNIEVVTLNGQKWLLKNMLHEKKEKKRRLDWKQAYTLEIELMSYLNFHPDPRLTSQWHQSCPAGSMAELADPIFPQFVLNILNSACSNIHCNINHHYRITVIKTRLTLLNITFLVSY